MNAKPLAEVYEKLKEHRRQGKKLVIPSEIAGISPTVGNGVLLDLGSLQEITATSVDGAAVVRFMEVMTLADRIFGDELKAKAWLQRPNASLSGQKPAELLKDELGAAVVREMLERIDHGIFA